jgi:hypothetical protein
LESEEYKHYQNSLPQPIALQNLHRKILFVFIPSLHKTEKNINNYKKNIEKEKNKKGEEEIINVPEQYKYTQKSEFT